MINNLAVLEILMEDRLDPVAHGRAVPAAHRGRAAGTWGRD